MDRLAIDAARAHLARSYSRILPVASTFHSNTAGLEKGTTPNRKRKTGIALRRNFNPTRWLSRGLAGVLGRAYVRRVSLSNSSRVRRYDSRSLGYNQDSVGRGSVRGSPVRDRDVDLAARTNLNLVLDLCGDVVIVPFLIRTRSHHYFRIGMPEDVIARFLDALRSRASSGAVIR